MTKTYQGHPSWQAWNVTLWIGNEEPIYRLAMSCLARHKKIQDAAIAFIDDLWMSKTPDGAEYDLKSVEHALSYLKD